MDPSSSSIHSHSQLNWTTGTDLSLHLWTAVAALAIAVPIQAWRLNRRNSDPVSISQQSAAKESRNDPSKPSPRPVLNTIDEEEDDLDVPQSSTSQELRNGEANQSGDPASRMKRSRDRRKRGPNPLRERSSRARQRVASWTLAASSEADKSAHAVTILEPPSNILDSSKSLSDKTNGKEQRKKRETSIASSSRTGTESLYGDLDEAASETASHLRFDSGPEQLPIIRAPSTSTSTSASAGDSYLDNSSITSASMSLPTSSLESSAACASCSQDSSRTLAETVQEPTPPLVTSNPKSTWTENKHHFDNQIPPSPARDQRKSLIAERRGSPSLTHPSPYFSHNIDSRSSTSSPSLNYSPIPSYEKEKEITTILYDSAVSNAQSQGLGSHTDGEPVVSLTTQISSLKGALSASRQREEALKSQCARLTAELQEARWRLGLWTQSQFQVQNTPWQAMPSGGVPVWGYPATPNSTSAPHSHPMSPMIPTYPGPGTFAHQNWGMTPLRDLQGKENITEHGNGDEDEDDRLDKSPVAEAILKRPGSFSRSRSRTGISSDESNHKDTGGEDKNSGSSEHASSSSNGQQISDENSNTEVDHSEKVDKPFLNELVFPSLLAG